MLRSTLLFLSRRKRLRRWMETSPTAGRLTTRFIAGLTLDDAVRVCAKLQREGVQVTLDRLGENVTSPDESEASRDRYLEALERIAAAGIDGSVSIKLTQLGLDLSEDLCRRNVYALARAAVRHGKMVEIDMESSEYVDRTLGIVTDLHASHGNVRAVIQSYLRRSQQDVETLCERKIPVRLCKGAYREPADVAFQAKREVNASYVRLMKLLLERGTYPAFATHDENMTGEAQRYVRERGMPPDRFEFQMLYGIRRDLEKLFVRQGYRLRLYVPFGEAWYPYFMRRLAERPANVLFLLRSLARG
jgi:proline dehydrogenase